MNYTEAQKFQARNRCAVCSGEPQLFPGPNQGYEVRCNKPEHKGFTRELTPTEAYDAGYNMPIYIADRIEYRRRRQMEQELGDEKTRALAPYQGVTTLTQEQAGMILRTIWPKAPNVEVFKAALICKMYSLNPLMKHLFLVEFKGREGSTWAPIIGIQATRLIASRQRPYTYLDGPRMMTKDEQMSIFGGCDDTVWRALTIITDTNGNQAPGYGSWPKATPVYGADKGNSQQNMAFIRSERQAFDRLFPGEMPQGVEVGDIQYLPPANERPPAKSTEKPPAGNGGITPAQINMVWTQANNRKLSREQVHAAIKARYQVESVKDLTKAQASELIDCLVGDYDIMSWTEAPEVDKGEES